MSEDMEQIIVDCGNHRERFTGRWLVVPDRIGTRADADDYDTVGHWDAGAYWGVALSDKGNLVVYTAHCNERWPGQLDVFATFEELERAITEAGTPVIPRSILGELSLAIGRGPIIIDRDI